MKRFKTAREVRAAAAARVGRDIPDPVWNLLREDGYVEEVLDPRDDDTFDLLLRRTRRLLALTNEHRSQEVTREQAIVSNSLQWNLLARLEAQAAEEDVRWYRQEYLSEEALAQIEDLWWFRRRYPSCNGLLSPEAARIWLMRQEKRQELYGGTYLLESLAHDLNREMRRQGVPWARSTPLRNAGPLFDLKHLCRRLSDNYHWQEVEGVDFVLTGEPPRSIAGYYSVKEIWNGRRVIAIEADVEMSPGEMAEWYSQIRRSVLGAKHRNRPLTSKIAALVDFVLDSHEDTTWEQKMQRWNAEHPDWRYVRADLFSRDYHRAARKIGPYAMPRWTGPEK